MRSGRGRYHPTGSVEISSPAASQEGRAGAAGGGFRGPRRDAGRKLGRAARGSKGPERGKTGRD